MLKTHLSLSPYDRRQKNSLDYRYNSKKKFSRLFVLDRKKISFFSSEYLQMALAKYSQGQTFGLISLGVIGWGAAALAVRYGSQIMFANDLRRFASFLGAPPSLYLYLRCGENLAQVSPRDRLTTASLMLTPALFLDGIAMMWFPDLYEDPSLRKTNPPLAVSNSRMGAAWILFGAGVVLGLGFL